MDADRSREPMTDAVVDRELQALLAVDPSPEFVASVRTRIASEPEPSQSFIAGLQLPTAWASWWSWRVATPILAVAVVFIAVLISRGRPVEQIQTLAATALPNTTTLPAYVVSASSYVVSAFRRTNADESRARASSGPAEAGRHVPIVEAASDIVLDPRETAALRALIGGVRGGNVDLAPVLRASTPSAMELPPIADIEIAPITIAPIAEEGVRQ